MIIIGILIVFYLSWVSSPKIAGNALVPNWAASWVDAYRYNTIRTAIPIIFLGVLSGLLILLENLKKIWWWCSWLILSLVVVVAEVGQFLRPLRIFDLEDIVWGSAGAAMGLLAMAIFGIILKILNRN